MKILGTGLSGLVGSRVVELLKNKYEFEDISFDSGIDITNKQDIFQKISASAAPIIIHLAAKTNVDECEEEKKLGNNGQAWRVNVVGTKNIVDACLKNGKKIIYISTDFVFDGEKETGGNYTEKEIPAPPNWYAQTKYEGERIVQASKIKDWIIVRLSYPYRAQFLRLDFVRTIIAKLQKGETISMVTDHYINPTFIDDIAYAFDCLMQKKEQGIFHVVGSECITPYDASIKIANVFKLNRRFIRKTTRSEFFKNRAPRGFNLCLNNDKIKKLGIKMSSFGEGLLRIKKQIDHL